MSIPEILHEPERAWAPFRPNAARPWDPERVAHLHRRAGFCPSWGRIERDRDEGFESSLQRLLDGEPEAVDGQPAADFETMADRMAASLGGSGDLRQLQATWLYRMVLHPPSAPRADDALLARSLRHVERQGQQHRPDAAAERPDPREHALGDFEALLGEMAQDPAMLVWLDSTTNRKAHPNENYAREVMELFTLGRGHYTETDIQEAARAFTGTFVRGELLSGDARPARRRREVHPRPDRPLRRRRRRRRSCSISPPAPSSFAGSCSAYFVSEIDEPLRELIAPLAAAFREADYDIRVPVEMILRSRLFLDAAMRRRRVKSPVELAVGTVRALEIVQPTVSPNALAEATANGWARPLFAPPSVAGWDWGPAWINTTTTLARTNFVLGVLGDAGPLGGHFDPSALVQQYGRSSEPADFYVDLLVQAAFDRDVRSRIRGDAREVATLVMTAPEYQLA